MSRKSIVLKRLVAAPFLLLAIWSCIFLVIKAAPGDPMRYFADEYAYRYPEYYEALRHELGFDKPVYEQFITYLVRLTRGDFGFSFAYSKPVLDVITERFFNTIMLTGSAFLFSIFLGVILGVIASKKPYSALDNAISSSSLMVASMPAFWISLIFLLAFGLHFRIFPPGGLISVGKTGIEYWLDYLWHLFLPAFVLGISNLAVYVRLTRASMLEQLGKDYILTAWSKGCSERTIYYKHALRNALLPIVTVIGMRMAWLLYGSVLVETVFAWPGMGMLIYDAIFARDYNIIMATFVLVSTLVIVFNLITDIIYTYLDPRIAH
jgi:peptide/nickel transport system permease protein